MTNRNLWLTSDQHFFHKNIIKYSQRPFQDEYEMNEILLENYNKIVKSNDIVFHLGDLSAGLGGRVEDLHKIISKMNGTKILLRGNHDYQKTKWYLEAGFSGVYYYLELGDYFISHYPLENNQYAGLLQKRLIELYENSKCTKIIHGHTHKREIDNKINVGVDLWNYEPVNFDTIKYK